MSGVCRLVVRGLRASMTAVTAGWRARRSPLVVRRVTGRNRLRIERMRRARLLRMSANEDDAVLGAVIGVFSGAGRSRLRRDGIAGMRLGDRIDRR